jgi:cbb3-type cytochrome oxidase maturation protein
MSILFLLIIISLVLASGFLFAFIRAAKSGQFDDDYTPSVRMLFDDELVENEEDETDNKIEDKESDINKDKTIEN